MSGATCGTWFAGAVVVPDAVVLVVGGGTPTAGNTGPGPAPILQALRETFPASKIVRARAVQPQACPAGSSGAPSLAEALATPPLDEALAVPSLDKTLVALAQAGERSILVLPTSAASNEALSQVEAAVASWRTQGAFRRLTLAQPPAGGATPSPDAMPQYPDALVEQAELAWWGKNPWFRQGR